MEKDILYIHDSHFSHSSSSSWYNQPDEFVWVRKHDENHIVFTDNSVHLVDNYNNKKKYAWLLESPQITPFSYKYIENNYHKFDSIFTFDKNLLDISEKFILTPIGGCWIESHNRLIFEKNKNVSMILSNKKQTLGHLLRHEIYNTCYEIDYFGFMKPISNKIEGLKDYRFSVVIENHKEDFYFTEKLIDCFVTGTIPIYWGCPSIDKFFDMDGILSFNNIDELDKILNNLNENLYLEKINSVNKNFELSKKYLICENKIYNLIKNECC